jgi:adenosine deaminase
MTKPGDYSRLVREYCEDAARAGVRYAELEISPAVTRGVQHRIAEAAEEAVRQQDVMVRFVLGLGRLMDPAIALPALDVVQDLPGFVGLGLGGPEDGYPNDPFVEVFAEARRRGLRAAPHAGENAGPASVRSALDSLGAERIQHGVRAVEDPALLVELAERRVPLAVCPTSNVRLGVAPSIEAHPLRLLWDAGVLVSVNTDDPGFFDCDLTGEYTLAGELLGLDRAGYAQLARNAVESSFAPPALKEEMTADIDTWQQGLAEAKIGDRGL